MSSPDRTDPAVVLAPVAASKTKTAELAKTLCFRLAIDLGFETMLWLSCKSSIIFADPQFLSSSLL